MRGMGIRVWLFFQSLGQLHECYGKHASIILSNMDTQQYFGLNDYETAELVSKRIGEQTILVKTDNGGGAGPGRSGRLASRSRAAARRAGAGRRRLPAGRCSGPRRCWSCRRDVALVFHRNLPCIPAKLLKYFDAPEFRNGGTGVQAGLGLGTVLASAAMLLVSLAIGLGAACRAGPTCPGWPSSLRACP